MSSAYHKLRSERHGALELGQQGAETDRRVDEARQLGRRFILEQRAAPSDIDALACLVRETSPAAFSLCGGIVSFEAVVCSALPEIPPGYAFKGGAARLALSQLLNPRRTLPPPRDLDLLRFDTRWNAQDSEVSRRIMRRDFERGRGVELCPGPERYFRSRDISINELYLLGGELRCTLACLLDTLGWVLRPCYYGRGSLHREAQLGGRILLKMLRLRAEAMEQGECWAVLGVPDEVEVEDFALAVELNKALFRGRSAAERFVAMCLEGCLFPAAPGTGLDEIILELSLGLYDGLDFFDELPLEMREELASLLARQSGAGQA